MREVLFEPTLEGWREAARRLIGEKLPPEEVLWREAVRPAEPGLFDPSVASPAPTPVVVPELRVPRAFVELARSAVLHPDADRWRVLYAALWRIAAGDRELLEREGDPDVDRLRRLERDVREGLIPLPPPPGAGTFVPPKADLDTLRSAAASCRGCDLYRHATQTVFGKGPAGARAVLVGEQPGDQEDLQGAPFVGPAGEVLDRALQEAGLPRDEVYVTNAVKHFKFFQRGKRRIHQAPGTLEIGACRPWLEAELAVIRPSVLVCLGATAGRALLGPDFRLLKQRGQFLSTSWAPRLLATYHPSAVLRAEDEAGQQRVYGTLVSDLRLVAGALGSAPGPGTTLPA